jgi:hypothetical protein
VMLDTTLSSFAGSVEVRSSPAVRMRHVLSSFVTVFSETPIRDHKLDSDFEMAVQKSNNKFGQLGEVKQEGSSRNRSKVMIRLPQPCGIRSLRPACKSRVEQYWKIRRLEAMFGNSFEIQKRRSCLHRIRNTERLFPGNVSEGVKATGQRGQRIIE